MNSVRCKDIFRNICAVWGFAVILFFLPIDFLFRVDSMRKFMGLFDIAVDLSVMINLFSIIIVLFAVANASLCLLLFRNRASYIWYVNLVMAAAFTGYTVVNFSVKWFAKTISMNHHYSITNTPAGHMILIVFLVAGFLFRKSLSERLLREKGRLLRILSVLCIFSIAVLCARIVQTRSYFALADEVQALPDLRLKPNVVLITFDSLRADDMSLYGYHHDTTPNLRKLSRQSYVFENMYADSNWTRPAVASILTGSRPSTHGLNFSSTHNIFAKNEKWVKNLPVYLKQHGFDTLASVGNTLYAHPWKTDNYDGFVYQPYERSLDRLFNPHVATRYLLNLRSSAGIWLNETVKANVPFVDYLYMKRYSKDRKNILDNQIGLAGEPAEFTFKQAEKLILQSKRPFFAWIHLFPPHSPYLPPAKFRHSLLSEKTLETRLSQRDPRADWEKLRLRYDEMILYADSAFADFLSFLKEAKLYDNTLLIVSSDHGESFEHGYKGHGGPYLYQQLVHIPLLIHLPGQNTGKMIKSNAEQIDIAPTIVDLLGFVDSGWFEGESLKAAMLEDYVSEKPKYLMNLEQSEIKGVRQSRSVAVVKGSYKYIYYPDWKRGELYDLARDHAEQHNLAQIEKERADYLHSLMIRDLPGRVR